MGSEIWLAPLRRSSWLGLFWPAYNRGSLWLLNIPEAAYSLGPPGARTCHQPEYAWSWEGDRLRASIPKESADPQAAIDLVFQPDKYGVAIDLRVTNVQSAPYITAASFGVCLRNSAAWRFGDPAGERTLVRCCGRWASLCDLLGSDAITKARNMPLGRSDSVSDEGIIARLNEDGTAGVAIAWAHVHELCSNLAPNISCIHSDPALGALPPGESTRVRGRLWFGRWDLDELYDLYREDVAPTFPGRG